MFDFYRRLEVLKHMDAVVQSTRMYFDAEEDCRDLDDCDDGGAGVNSRGSVAKWVTVPPLIDLSAGGGKNVRSYLTARRLLQSVGLCSLNRIQM